MITITEQQLIDLGEQIAEHNYHYSYTKACEALDDQICYDCPGIHDEDEDWEWASEYQLATEVIDHWKTLANDLHEGPEKVKIMEICNSVLEG